MSLQPPTNWIASGALKWVLIVSFLVGVATMYGWEALNGPLKNEITPDGVVSLEYAGSLEVAQEMLASWGPSGQVLAAANLGLDYFFLFFYSGTILLACALARMGFARWRLLADFGVLLAWLQILAGLSDALENYSLLQLVLGSADGRHAVVAKWAATIKAGLNATGIGYAIAGFALLIVFRVIGKPSSHAV